MPIDELQECLFNLSNRSNSGAGQEGTRRLAKTLIFRIREWHRLTRELWVARQEWDLAERDWAESLKGVPEQPDDYHAAGFAVDLAHDRYECAIWDCRKAEERMAEAWAGWAVGGGRTLDRPLARPEVGPIGQVLFNCSKTGVLRSIG